MVSNITKLGLGSLILFFISACTIEPKKNNLNKKIADTCKYNVYNAGRIVSNLSCKFCHLSPDLAIKDDKGWPTFRGLARMDSLKLIDYTFTKKHKGWFSKNGPYKNAKIDTLSDCEIRSVIRYIKDFDRDISLPSQ
ncbi:hypothetical protein EV200_101260 [Pedobacter psychrotolerans]|uniref:Cytochrome c domain-containing protein n=1 Tax=Pedobacter psychrotolerans TaxID=1843235 RepID=A0A4R2HQ51_9SPHI|nr:hypothetical protein [Pedobacter psychrotolerans]TCO30821.1 hypothetical protein EV200_101260 [Pedobacter psychrotolerans]GGE44235.1 hypothetical protein GCM10011413_07890 [Pedobacter psychrotolerans]